MWFSLRTRENIKKSSLNCEINPIFNVKPLNILYISANYQTNCLMHLPSACLKHDWSKIVVLHVHKNLRWILVKKNHIVQMNTSRIIWKLDILSLYVDLIDWFNIDPFEETVLKGTCLWSVAKFRHMLSS